MIHQSALCNVGRLAAFLLITPALSFAYVPGPGSPPAPTPRYQIDLDTCSRPTYPMESLRREEQGTVVIRFLLSPEGTVVDTELIRSSGYEALDKIAIAALRKCHFTSATGSTQSLAGSSMVAYDWKIEPVGDYPPIPIRRETKVPNDPSAGKPNLPLDRRYAELTREQMEQFNAKYEAVEPGDEPPYPADGLVALMRPLTQAQRMLRAPGLLSFEVEVDASGNATAVDVLQSPNQAMTDFAARLAMGIKYKPAVCKGQSCKMRLPIRTENMTIR